MTQRERDARWWRTLARDYERRSRRAIHTAFWDCRGLCSQVAFGYRSDDNQRRYRQLITMGKKRGFWWPEVSGFSPDAYDLRATACCLIAAMVEAGDA